MALKESIFNVQKLASKVHKDGSNPHIQSKFPTLESVLDVLNEPLTVNNLVLSQFTQYREFGWVLTTELSTADGKESLFTETPLFGLDDAKNKMQALGSAITYARRYALMSLFKLAPTDDDGSAVEGLNFVPEVKPKKDPPKSNKPRNFAPPFKDLKIADGTYRGKKISEIPSAELRAYVEKVEKVAKEGGKPHPKWFTDLKGALVYE